MWAALRHQVIPKAPKTSAPYAREARNECGQPFFFRALFPTTFKGAAALAGVAVAAFLAAAARLLASAVFFAVAALRLARVLWVFAWVMPKALPGFRRRARLVVMFVVCGTS